MIPPKEKLLPYINNRKEAAKIFSVTEKTVIRWLEKYGLYEPKDNFGCNKLSLEKAREIRQLSKKGKSKKELAEMYSVTFSTISRIVHNIVYRETTEFAKVSVVNNVSVESSGSRIS